MKIQSVKGCNDYLPGEVAIRDYLTDTILKVYENNGFHRIMTPAIEDAENLDKSDGGDNLNLIFKILKRGEKLEKALATGDEKELTDLGLRYDLTLPLTRYYAANREKLAYPMKCIQIDKVYRAERPQKGRLREFVQCDIDILGSDSINSEVELILTTAKALQAIPMNDFKIVINDRRLLRSMLTGCGFSEESLDTVCISFDKMDKIGAEGVREELTSKGCPESAVDRLVEIIGMCPLTLDKMSELCDRQDIVENLRYIMKTVKEVVGDSYEVEYDPSLVRGQGYYTGTVFEIKSTKFNGAIGGGGRYDGLIGKFIGENVPSVGFSIGFERLFSILSENGFEIPSKRKSVALIYNPDEFTNAVRKADELRKSYDVSMFEFPKKLGKFLSKLAETGYQGFLVFGKDEDVKPIS